MPVSTKPSRWGEPMRHSLDELEAFDAIAAIKVGNGKQP